jgi:hypothetical protein
MVVDPEEKRIIDTLADFVNRHGRALEILVTRRENSRPQFQFLFGGPGNAYYKWKLYCEKNNLPSGTFVSTFHPPSINPLD